MQLHITKHKLFLVKLLSCLYNNIDSHYNLFIDNSNIKNDNIVLVLPSLFVPWKFFSNYFKKFEAIKSIILLLC